MVIRNRSRRLGRWYALSLATVAVVLPAILWWALSRTATSDASPTGVSRQEAGGTRLGNDQRARPFGASQIVRPPHARGTLEKARGLGPGGAQSTGGPSNKAAEQNAAAQPQEEPPGDEPSGIALFPPPGTNPPKSGIIVPEDFELPPGYVRHYQVTDDGKPLPPILMFHPDAELYDAEGKPIPLPDDLVVPPELAPPGLPVEILQVPENQVPFMEPPPDDAGVSSTDRE
ncbi:MAG: hypothetical protein KatS3mg077_2414 [Candidatus Binatia bacterium]|nr:MAG: hypothetical protein KatS3mg077_2414 [Candidatus Binatia bacterium]